MAGKYLKTPAAPDEVMDQPLIDVGVKYVKQQRKGEVAAADQELPNVPVETREEPVPMAEWEYDDGYDAMAERKIEEEQKKPFPEKLVRCGKFALAFGGIQALLFWWLETGLLAGEAAWPSMVVCAALGGLTVGWNAK